MRTGETRGRKRERQEEQCPLWLIVFPRCPIRDLVLVNPPCLPSSPPKPSCREVHYLDWKPDSADASAIWVVILPVRARARDETDKTWSISPWDFGSREMTMRNGESDTMTDDSSHRANHGDTDFVNPLTKSRGPKCSI